MVENLRQFPRFAGGCWIIDLAETSDADGIAHAVAEGLGVPLATEGEPVELVAGMLQYRDPMLLVLDNFEQVREYAQDTVGLWIDPCGRGNGMGRSGRNHRCG